MATQRVVEKGRAGGRSVLLFQDEDGGPADESVAAAVVIVEYNAAGEETGRIYGSMGDRQGDAPDRVKPSPFRRPR